MSECFHAIDHLLELAVRINLNFIQHLHMTLYYGATSRDEVDGINLGDKVKYKLRSIVAFSFQNKQKPGFVYHSSYY